jgi:tetratricopeptide (TPR) repeat protein
MRSRRVACALLALIVLLSPLTGVEACGPDIQPDVFVRASLPDDLNAFDRGHLGILQTGFDSNEYAVAYRYLNGGKVSETEVPSTKPPLTGAAAIEEESKIDRQAERDAEPAAAWDLARAKYVSASEAVTKKDPFPRDAMGNLDIDPNYPNCPVPAFRNAVVTLDKRAEAWGKQSPWLVDWIRGQDAVFANCTAATPEMPAPAAANGPALLRADRAYQLAAAALYAKQYDQAMEQFEAIAHDKSSPWNAWGEYLAARAMVRKAFAMGKKTEEWAEAASFDLGTMQRAQQMLEAILAQANPRPSRKIVANELEFVRLRTEPEKRLAEICAALAGPGTDENFAQDRMDLDYVLGKRIAIKNPPPLYEWIAAFRGTAQEPPYSVWRANHALPWLVVALVRAEPTSDEAADLVAEAAKIRPDLPAYDTVFYHRVRLLIGLHRADEARALLDKALPALRTEKPGSTANALLAERLSVARNFDEFLEFAPRKVLETEAMTDANIAELCDTRKPGFALPGYCPQPGGPPRLDQSQEFDEDSVNVLNRQVPLAMLLEAATSPKLPPNLRRSVALAAWTRSVVLEDGDAAAKVAPLLPEPLRKMAGTGVDFQANFAILRNPGLRPYLEPGASRLVNFNELDVFRDNWWCKRWERRMSIETPKSEVIPVVPFLTKEEASAGVEEAQRVQQVESSVAFLGQHVVDYAQEHPEDPQVPEALAMVVRAGHYACQDYEPNSRGPSASTAVSKAAFQILHRRYPKSPWTAKTPYYY